MPLPILIKEKKQRFLKLMLKYAVATFSTFVSDKHFNINCQLFLLCCIIQLLGFKILMQFTFKYKTDISAVSNVSVFICGWYSC